MMAPDHYLCSRYCPGCNTRKHINHFISNYCGSEFEFCSGCRVLNPSSHYRSSLYNNILFRDDPPEKSNKPTYYDVSIEEPTTNTLMGGEKVITYDRLVKETDKQYKQRKRNRVKRRKYKYPPWKYETPPTSQYEEDLQNQYEKFWHAGLDECLPDILLKQKSWDSFWIVFRKTHFLQNKTM